MEVWRMLYVLKVYWLLCNKSCVENSRPFEHVKNWFLKRRLDTNLCQVLIDVKYTRDWQLGLKKNLLNKTNNIRYTENEVFREGF